MARRGRSPSPAAPCRTTALTSPSRPIISGAGAGITKTGAGTLTLSNTNTYTGATTVNAGTLLVNGSQSGSAVTVNSGAILGGTNGTVGAISVFGWNGQPGRRIGRIGHPEHRKRELQLNGGLQR